MSKLKLLDLFSGIGGFSLGLERTGGFETVAFCEIEDFPRKVLAKHWPEVPCYDDVRTLTAESLRRDGIRVDAICGGFPCQDISTAGKGAGIEGERSGLWREYARLIGELRPQVVFVENVSALLGRGLDRVLGDLAAIGYDAEWHCIRASACGAWHHRNRLWLIGYPNKDSKSASAEHDEAPGLPSNFVSYSDEAPREGGGLPGRVHSEHSDINSRGGGVSEILAHAMRGRQQGQRMPKASKHPEAGPAWQATQFVDGCLAPIWEAEPAVGRVVDGVSPRVDRHRLAGLGNAVVPQIPELLGNAYLESIGWSAAA